MKSKKLKIPRNPGVYFFKNAKNKIIYIGKAANLKNRLRSYFSKSNQDARVLNMLKNAERVSWQKTGSEIEALILESQLIKKYHPDFNILMRDDKQYFYVGFTKEKFPRVLLTHQPNKVGGNVSFLRRTPRRRTAKETLPPTYSQMRKSFLGPFTSGAALKSTLKLLRKIFPYCTCKEKHNNYCLNYHLGNCPGFCCFKVDKSQTEDKKSYQKNVRNLKDILSGKRLSLAKKMEREMSQEAKNGEFIKAIAIRNKLRQLRWTFENAKIWSEFKTKNKALKEIQTFFNLPVLPKRIEAYDISNIQDKFATGAMAVFTDGQPDKSQYRKFKIKSINKPDDTGMLQEILLRRFKHSEWPLPDLIILDGGKPQLNAAVKTTPQNIPTIALTKNRKHHPHKVLTLSKVSPWMTPWIISKLPRSVQNLLIGINSEAHRFAISYHRNLRRL